MRARVWFLGLALSFALAWPASAQQFTSSMGSKTTGSSIPTSIPSFFSSPLSKPDTSAFSVRPPVPGPLNLGNMMPTFPNLQNTMLLRNVFGGPQALMQMPRQQAAPPPSKKKQKNATFFP